MMRRERTMRAARGTRAIAACAPMLWACAAWSQAPGDGANAAKPAPASGDVAPMEPVAPAGVWAVDNTFAGPTADGLRLGMRVDRTTLTPAETVRVRLSVDAPVGAALTLPAFAESLGEDWQILSQLTRREFVAVDAPADVGPRRMERTIVDLVLGPFLPGERALPAWRVSAPGLPAVTTAPVPVRVTSTLPKDGSVPELRPKPPVDEAITPTTDAIAAEKDGVPRWAIGGAVLALVAIAVAALMRGRRRTVDPVQEAIATLERAAAQAGAGDADGARAYTTLGAASAALRTIITHTTGVGATSRTAAELRSLLASAMDAHPMMGVGVREDVVKALSALEAAQFNPAARDADAARAAVVMARDVGVVLARSGAASNAGGRA